MRKVLINLPNWRRLIKRNALELLEQAEFQIIANETGKMAERSFVERYIADIDAIIAGGEKIDADLISRGKKLKIIARYGVGVDNIDVEFASERKIIVTTTKGVNANSVAEHTVALILAAQRHFKYYINTISTGSWEIIEFPELSNKTVGLIGFGCIAKLAAKRLSGFEVRLLVYDPYIEEKVFHEFGAEAADIDTLLKESDIVSLHIPYRPDTHHFINESRLKMMKKTAYLINTARGALIDESALFSALEQKELAGAALDVVENEPFFSDSRLAALPNVLITPHIAGGSYENHEKAGILCVRSILQAFGIESDL